MTVSPLSSTPMIGRAADAPASATPGTGFGDLLSVLGAALTDGGKDGSVPTPPLADRNAATLGGQSAKTVEALPAVALQPSDAPVPGTAETTALVTPPATGVASATPATGAADGGVTPADSTSLSATPVDGGQVASVTDATAAIVTDADKIGADKSDADKDAPASPVATRPRVDPTPAPQPAVTADMVTTPPAMPPADAPIAAAPTPDAAVAVAATGGAGTPVADAAASSSLAAAGPRTRASRQTGADTLASNLSATPMAETMAGVGAPVPRDAVAGARSPSQDDRGKAKSSDRASGSDDTQALAPTDPTLMPLATVMTTPVNDQPGLTDAGFDQDNGQSTAGSPASSAAPVSQFAGGSAQQLQPGQDNLPSLLASQTPTGPIARSSPLMQPYAAAPSLPSEPVIAAQPGRIGRDMGVEIARQVSAGRQEMLVRLDPAEMGRIDVRLSFDDKGHLHAAMSADSPAALDMLRRDAGDLGRALAGAGIQTDASTFRFDSRSNDAGHFAQHQQQGGQRDNPQDRDGGNRRGRNGNNFETMTASYRQLRTSSRVDLTA